MEHGKAIKKPVEIDWFEWQNEPRLLMKWCESFGDVTSENFTLKIEENLQLAPLRVLTLEGISYEVPSGYIIIRGVEGEYYPCEPTIFHKTYTTL